MRISDWSSDVCSSDLALAAGAREVWVAADDERIVRALAGSGVQVALTATTHASGTDRLAECADIAGWDDDTIVVNLQRHEPFAPAAGLDAVASTLAASPAPTRTLAAALTALHAPPDTNIVNRVRRHSGH